MDEQKPIITNNFATGIFSPRMIGRIDLPQYAHAAEDLENMIVFPFGSTTRRPGTKYIDTLPEGEARLLPFKVSEGQNYIVALTDQAATIYSNGSQVRKIGTLTNILKNSNKIPTKEDPVERDESGYVFSGTCDPSITQVDAKRYRIDLRPEYEKTAPYNRAPHPKQAAMTVKYYLTEDIEPGTYYLSFKVVNDDDKDFNEATQLALRCTISIGNAHYIASVHKETHFESTFVITAEDLHKIPWDARDVLCFTYTLNDNFKYSKGFVMTRWLNRYYDNAVVRFTFSRKTSGYGKTNYPFRFGHASSGDPIVLTTPYAEGDLYNLQYAQQIDKMYLVHPSYPPQVLTRHYHPVTSVSPNEITDAFTWETADQTQYNTDIKSVESMEPLTWNKMLCPSTVAFWGQRLWFGGTQADPGGLWASKLNDITDFKYSNEPQKAEAVAPFKVSLIGSQRMNKIKWALGHKKLLVGTEVEEWSIGPMDKTTAISAKNVAAVLESAYGSANPGGQAVGGNVLFAGPGGRQLCAYSYDNSVQSYTANSISKFNDLLQGDSIVEFIYSPIPFGLLFLITHQNRMLVCTYAPEEKVLAWTRFTTKGKWLSCASIPDSNSLEGASLYVAVKREITTVNDLEQPVTTQTNVLEQFYPITCWESGPTKQYLDCTQSVSASIDTADLIDLTLGMAVQGCPADSQNLIMLTVKNSPALDNLAANDFLNLRYSEFRVSNARRPGTGGAPYTQAETDAQSAKLKAIFSKPQLVKSFSEEPDDTIKIFLTTVWPPSTPADVNYLNTPYLATAGTKREVYINHPFYKTNYITNEQNINKNILGVDPTTGETTSLTGLSIDGAPDLMRIVVPEKNYVMLVGLSYDSTIITLPLEDVHQLPLLGRPQRISSIFLRLYKSLGGSYAVIPAQKNIQIVGERQEDGTITYVNRLFSRSCFNSLYDFKISSMLGVGYEELINPSDTEMLSGDFQVPLIADHNLPTGGGYTNSPRLIIKQQSPFPLTVLYISYDYNSGDAAPSAYSAYNAGYGSV